MNEPGKYDAECTELRLRTKARAAMVVVFDGDRGHGFSIQTETPKFLLSISDTLRYIADQIDEQRRRAEHNGEDHV